jgi:beta-xylosidase
MYDIYCKIERKIFFQWTTDQDLQDAMASIGVSDLVSIKFHENRTNGQSKGLVYSLLPNPVYNAR